MYTVRQWLEWIVFLGVVPTAALLPFARFMREHELDYYVVGLPALLLYFFIMGRLGVKVPGQMEELPPETEVEAYRILSFRLTSRQLVGRVLLRLRAITVLAVMPSLGAGLIFYGVRDGEIVGYFLGPAMIWVSGGCWAMLIQLFVRKRAELRKQSE